MRNDEAAKLAEAAGLKVVMNRCPKIEYGRLSSEIAWIGVNSRTLSSKRAQILGKGVQRMGLDERGATPSAMRARRRHGSGAKVEPARRLSCAAALDAVPAAPV